ncbi:MAG: sulfurtransferase [Limisphaerales bacterium]|nr:MAG: sulfurtransferase [Limisphaerales bacterium]
MEHSPGFLAIVNEVREKISEVSVDQARERLKTGKHAALVDVREDREWDKQHASEAVHLGKGVLERDIENMFPDKSTELIMYCGGGYRSALTAEVAQRMGYLNVHSLAGGYKALLEADWPMNKLGAGK